jgi:alpha-tubulin suppressor-like RCC1 family protein
MAVNESNTIQYTIVTSRVTDGTVLYWKTTGNTTNSDITGGNTGTVTIVNNRALLNVAIIADASTDGTKTLGITLLTGSLSGTPVINTASDIIVTDTSRAAIVYVWGNNRFAQLGLNDRVYRSSPTQLGSGSGSWAQITMSSNSGLATKTNGTLWAWGSGSNGNLGTNDTVNRSSPVQVGTDTNWSKVNALSGVSFGVRTNGTLYSWGSNTQGFLGLSLSPNGTVYRSSPTQVGAGTTWLEVFAGYSMLHAVKTDGTLWAWGQGRYGTFGNGTYDANFDRLSSSPIQIGSLTDWTNKLSSNKLVGAIKSNGTLWAWGAAEGYGGLGLNTTYAWRSSPVQVGALTTWTSIATNSFSMWAIKSDGTLWAWGRGIFGALGFNNSINVSSPTQIGTGTNWSKLSAQNYSVLATKTDGTLWLWGYNGYGVSGMNDAVSYRSSPTQLGTDTTWTGDVRLRENTAVAIQL